MSTLVEQVRASKVFSPAIAKTIRLTAGVSQERLAEELGVHRVTIARWEDGSRTPRGPLLIGYLELLRELQRVSVS